MDASHAELLQKAQTYLRSSAVLLELEDFDSCASRAYFAMFYAAQALVMEEQGKVGAGRGIRSAFNQLFVDTGRLPRRAGDAFDRIAEYQEVGDYAHHFAISESQAEWALQEAEAFVNSIARMLEQTA